MQKYAEMKNIIGDYKSTDNVKIAADLFRKKLFSYDKYLLQETDICIDSTGYKEAPDGRFVISHKGVDFDCLFHRNRDNSDILYVILSGARTAGNSQPTFKRWSYYNFMDGHMLNIDDPMCRIHKNLSLGWYYGTKTECYCDYLSEIVEEFAYENGITNNNIIFYGSSGGGYAALYCACKIPGSFAVAINPQINLRLHPYSSKFEDIVGVNLSEEDIFLRNNLSKLIKDSVNSRFIIIENVASSEDMLQLNELCSTLDTEFHYGLTELKQNILSWVYEGEAGKPHNAQEYPQIFFAIEFLIKNFDSAEKFSDIYLLLSEFWYEHYNLVREKDYEKHEKTRLLESYSLNNGIETISRTIVNQQNSFVIPALQNKWNHFVIFDNFAPETFYILIISDVLVLNGNCSEFTVLIRNSKTKRIDISKNCNYSRGG